MKCGCPPSHLVFWLFTLLSCVVGCGGAAPRPECKEPELVQLAINPSTLLNEGEDGASRSVILRVYQLTRRDAFDRAVYDELWHADPKAALSETLVAGPDETLLVAGLPLTLPLPRHPEAQFIAIAGKFRNTQSAWRAVTSLPPHIDPCESQDAGLAANRLLALAKHSDLSFQPGRSP